MPACRGCIETYNPKRQRIAEVKIKPRDIVEYGSAFTSEAKVCIAVLVDASASIQITQPKVPAAIKGRLRPHESWHWSLSTPIYGWTRTPLSGATTQTTAVIDSGKPIVMRKGYFHQQKSHEMNERVSHTVPLDMIKDNTTCNPPALHVSAMSLAVDSSSRLPWPSLVVASSRR
jgi:hypothetical protein